jgi:hypothetical protein
MLAKSALSLIGPKDQVLCGLKDADHNLIS